MSFATETKNELARIEPEKSAASWRKLQVSCGCQAA